MTGSSRDVIALFFVSFTALYFELLTIRYLSSEVRIFTNLKNVPLVASFFGMGLGMLLGRPSKRIGFTFPVAVLLLFLTIRFAAPLHLTSGDLSWNYGLVPNASLMGRLFYFARFLFIALAFSGLVCVFLAELGGLVGEYLRRVPPLTGYGVNLAGSLAGVVFFSILAFFGAGPGLWLLFGFGSLIPYFLDKRTTIVAYVVLVAIVALPQPNTFWSPYYRIDLVPVPPPSGWDKLSYAWVVPNHGWITCIADLSPEFLQRFPNAEPNRTLSPYYNLPYKIVSHPKSVLVLGAGAGNDVASALRHGAEHVDAVEIDPVIYRLARDRHPEHPYNSPRVTIHVQDARTFLQNTSQKYDLIVFGYLDSTSLLGSFSSLRMDNYVYTLQSFQRAKELLNDRGTLILTFATGRNFATDRLYATLEHAFAIPPSAYFIGYYLEGVLLVEGQGRKARIPGIPEVSLELQARSNDAVLATDQWPFLYLTDRSIPAPILVVAGLFIFWAWVALRWADCMVWRAGPAYLHFFFLGAGFLLLETKAVTQLSLLFGSTWLVNSVVIGSFLIMALASNLIVSLRSFSASLCCGGILLLLTADLFVPYAALNHASPWLKIVLAGGWTSLPVFFSGLVFSTGLKRYERSADILGINLFGAVAGGLLENTVMLGGTMILGLLAIALYSGALICLGFSGRSSSLGVSTEVLAHREP